ncbi:acyltransferase family protein [Enterococcus sp. HY326]|uniref:acyltransferase family protein n=1 Tax=Enterococcus sp. HY326 TaxID=2971265 RepID=UPI00223EA434|nr:acyltransferase family protein [Enterococcus sp. HY326]
MKHNRDFQLLYLAQFIFALFVVLVHSGTVTANQELHFFLKNMVARLAVPFFVINNVFFYAQKESWGQKKWFKKNVGLYVIWSIIYLPLGIQFIQEYLQLPIFLYPIAALVGLVYTGVFYHLWYFPAVFVGIILVKKIIDRWGYLKAFLGLVVFYVIGASETYSAYLAGTFMNTVMDKYFATFLTTRNGLFFTGIFILIGFYLAEHHEKLMQKTKLNFLGLGVSALFFLTEGWLVFSNQGRDVNFFFLLIPLSFFFFLILLSYRGKSNFCYLKKYGQGIFFFHMVPIQLFNIFVTTTGLSKPEMGTYRLILGIGASFLMVETYSKIKELKANESLLPKLSSRH